MNLILTEKQKKAIKLAKSWYVDKHTDKKILTIGGYAGTGKTTIVNILIKELGLSIDNVLFVAYTGVASTVLTSKGNPASTIHSAIYNTTPIIDQYTGDVKFIFTKKTREEIDPDIKLIVLDEGPMCPMNILKELLSYDIKVIGLGDPGQLDAIGEKNYLFDKPDIFLDEIMRQKKDDPLIYLSMLARKKMPIKYGKYGDNCVVVPRRMIREEYYRDADQIIATKNVTVNTINNYYRKNLLKIDSKLPVKGDKLMVVKKNNWNLSVPYKTDTNIFLVNGLIGHAKNNLYGFKSRSATALLDFEPSLIKTDRPFNEVLFDIIPFNEGLSEEEEMIVKLFRKPFMDARIMINQFSYAYAITCHKCQGSEFDNVLFLPEVINRKSHHKILYTGITRAKKGLILSY